MVALGGVAVSHERGTLVACAPDCMKALATGVFQAASPNYGDTRTTHIRCQTILWTNELVKARSWPWFEPLSAQKALNQLSGSLPTCQRRHV